MKYIILICASALFLNGCISLKDNTPPPTLFLLNAQNQTSQTKPSFPYAIIIDKPKIKSGLNTDRIALTRDYGRVLDYFAEARWNGRLENILQDYMIETLENSFKNISVSDTAIDQEADFKIISHIHDFQAEYADGNLHEVPVLSLSFSAIILRLKDNKIIADIKVRETMTAPSNTLTDITYGLEVLTQQGFEKLSGELNRVRR